MVSSSSTEPVARLCFLLAWRVRGNLTETSISVAEDCFEAAVCTGHSTALRRGTAEDERSFHSLSDDALTTEHCTQTTEACLSLPEHMQFPSLHKL